MRTARNPDSIHAPGGYQHQIEVTGPQRWLVLAGQIGVRADDSVPTDAVEQTEVAVANLAANLDAAGMGPQDVVKMTVYLVGDVALGDVVGVVGRWLGGRTIPMVVLYVAALATPAFLVEIDAQACQDDPSS